MLCHLILTASKLACLMERRLYGILFLQVLVRAILLSEGVLPHLNAAIIDIAFRACSTNRQQAQAGSQLPRQAPWMVQHFETFRQAAGMVPMQSALRASLNQ